MAKHLVFPEEKYPVYDLGDRAGTREVELPEGFIERYTAVEKEWEEVQAIMGNAWEEAE